MSVGRKKITTTPTHFVGIKWIKFGGYENFLFVAFRREFFGSCVKKKSKPLNFENKIVFWNVTTIVVNM